jgi:hypothetical protein
MYLPESWGDTGSTIRCGEGGLRNDSKIRQSYDKPSARLGDDLFRSEIVALGRFGTWDIAWLDPRPCRTVDQGEALEAGMVKHVTTRKRTTDLNLAGRQRSTRRCLFPRTWLERKASLSIVQGNGGVRHQGMVDRRGVL